MISRFLIVMLVPLILSIGVITPLSFADHHIAMSPKKQMANGIAAEDVICKGGYTLMIRMSGDAACVTPSTASKLNSAGWGEIIKEFEVQPEPHEEEITLDEEVNMEDEKSSNGEEDSEGQTIEVNINDGVGSSDSP